MAHADMRKARSNRDAEMAADLKRRGIFHGVRLTKSNADPFSYLRPDLIGTARYRRLRRGAS